MLDAVAEAQGVGRKPGGELAGDADDSEGAVLGGVADLKAHAGEELAQKPAVRDQQQPARHRARAPLPCCAARRGRSRRSGAEAGDDVSEKVLRAQANVVPRLAADGAVDPGRDPVQLRHALEVLDRLPLRLAAALLPQARVAEDRRAGGEQADDGLGRLEGARQVADEDGGERDAPQPLRHLDSLQAPDDAETLRNYRTCVSTENMFGMHDNYGTVVADDGQRKLTLSL